MVKESLALTIRQPWAWLIVNGYKDIENRTWQRPGLIGQSFLVHSSKRLLTQIEYQEFLILVRKFNISNYPLTRFDFDYGKLVGIAKIEGIVSNSLSPWAIPGNFHFQVFLVKKFSKPISYPGQLGFFKVKV